jgi:hypothetical protein
MAEVNKGMGDSSIPNRQKPQAHGMPGRPNVNKGIGDESVPQKKDWRSAIKPNGGKVGKAPLD